MSDKKYGFWKFCSDNSEGLWWLIVIVLVLVFGLLGIGPCSNKAHAKCVVHTVERGDTLGKISKQYYVNEDGYDKSHWQDIKWQNELKTTRLKVGQKLGIYLPDENDWFKACQALINMRIDELRLTRDESLALAIAQGINMVGTNELGYTPAQKYEACRWAAATAHQESLFQFAIGGAGEVGMYQFKLNTIRLTGRWYKLKPMAKGTDATLVQWLIDPVRATEIFLLHYAELYKRYNNNVWFAWKRYNNGSEAHAYASKAVKRYWQVRKLQPVMCKP